MLKFSTFNEKLLRIIGISFFSKKNVKCGKFLQFLAVLSIVTLAIQSLMFTITYKLRDINMASAFVTTLNGFQSIYKVLNVILQRKRVQKVKLEIEELFQKISKENIKKFSSDIKMFPRLAKFNFLFMLALSTSVIIIGPLSTLIIGYLRDKIIVKSLAFTFWYPFNIDPLDYYWFIWFYQTIFSILTVVATNASDGTIILSIGQLVILFNSLAEDFSKIINDYDEKYEQKTSQELNKKITLHSHLLDLALELLKIHEIYILVYVITFASSTCFLLVNALLDPEFMLQTMIIILNSLIYLYYLCYFGQRLVDSVSRMTNIELNCIFNLSFTDITSSQKD